MAETLGDILIEAREDAGLTPADLAKITKIPSASIRALECNDFEALPAPVFVRGFIRAYCREVDVDPGDALMAYDAHLHEEELVSAADLAGETDDRTAMGPLLFVGSDNMPAASSGRGLQIGHMLLLLLALVTFIIAYVTAGLPSQTDMMSNADQMDRASTTTSTTNTSSPPARPTNNQ